MTEIFYNSSCIMDPHGWVSQIIGFVAAFLVLAHGVPSFVKSVKALNQGKTYTESKTSLCIRIVLGMLTGTWGICICQLSPVVGGFGSVIVLTPQLVIIYILDKRSVALAASLALAASRGQLEVVKHLCKHTEADPATMITMAAIDGHLEVVLYLCEHTKVNPAAEYNDAVGWAAMNGHLPVVQYLCEHTGTDATVDDNYAVRRAARSGKLDVVKYLCEQTEANPTAQNNYAVLWAAKNGHLDVVRYLCEHTEADPTADDTRAVKCAAKNGYDDVAQYLREFIGTL